MLDSWRQVIEELPWARLTWDILVVVLPLSALLIFAGIFFISTISRILGVVKKRSAFEKCSTQLALPGMVLGWVLLIGSRVWLYATQDEHPAESLENFLNEICWIMLSMGVLLSTIFYFTRRLLKNMPVLHSVIGVIAAIQNCIGLVVILFTLRLYAWAVPVTWVSERLAFLGLEITLLELCVLLPPLVFSMAGGFAACYLFAQRNRDQFGRDYYNTMIPWCAAWARNAWIVLYLIVLVSTIWFLWGQPGAAEIPFLVAQGVLLIFWLLPLLCWGVVRASRLPARNGLLLYFALAIAMCFTLQFYALLTSSSVPNPLASML